ncbi:MAG: efflux RND transporter periplasmic adaptor subunit [Pirellulales bacterium]
MSESNQLVDDKQSVQSTLAIPESRSPLPWHTRAGHVLPTLLVLAGLATAAYLGHRNGWAVPKFSALWSGGDASIDDWCAAHDVPESGCVECQPDVLPLGKDYGWCGEHGVHQCPLCHPDVAQLTDPPQLSGDDLARSRRALALTQRPENNSRCKLYRRRVQFASADAVERAGVQVEVVQRRPITESIDAAGEVIYDQSRVAHLAPRVAGTVWRVETELGQQVKQHDVLALIDAAEVGRAKAALLQAVVQTRLKQQALDRLEAVASALAERQLREGRAELSAARISLLGARQALVNLGLPVDADELMDLPDEALAERVQFLGLPKELTDGLNPETTTANLIPITAPFDAVVVDFEVVAGEVVEPAKTLFVLADPSQMWLTLHARQEDSRHLALGQKVRFRPDGGTREAAGQVTWISTAVDPRTRTVTVRATLENRSGDLRAHSYGSGQIVLREESQAIAVPSEAIHWDGSCHVVFVRDKNFFKKDAPKVFHTRTVRPAAKLDQFTELVAGVLPGEVVAGRGSAVLRAALLKNNLGAG